MVKYLKWGRIEKWEEVFSQEGKDIAAIVIASNYPEMEKGKDYRERFLESCYRNGVSLYDVPYVNYSHEEKDIQEALRKIESGIIASNSSY